jgi:hypothetical protein
VARFGARATSLSVVERQSGGAVIRAPDRRLLRATGRGRQRLPSIPGFEETRVAALPAAREARVLEARRSRRQVRIASIRRTGRRRLSSLRPSFVGKEAMYADANGTVSSSHAPRAAGQAFRARVSYPEKPPRLAARPSGRREEGADRALAAALDRTNGQLLLARKLRVRVAFAGQEPGEVSRGGSRGLAALNRGRNAGGNRRNGGTPRGSLRG